MIFDINTTSDISKLSQISRAVRRVKLRITVSKYHSWYMPNITTNHAITYTNTSGGRDRVISAVFSGWYRLLLLLSPRTAGSQAFSVNAFRLRIPETHRPREIMRPGD